MVASEAAKAGATETKNREQKGPASPAGPAKGDPLGRRIPG